MLKSRRFLSSLATGGLVLAIAGGAYAASRDVHVMNVTMPDGSIAQVEYSGKVAPHIRLAPADADRGVADVDPAFARIDAMFANMERQHEAMMQHVAAIQRAAFAQANQVAGNQAGTNQAGAVQNAVLTDQGGLTRTVLPGGMVLLTNGKPAGNVSFHYVSTTTSANGCTQTVEYRSEGNAQPQVTHASAGSCDAAKPAAPVQANVVKPVAPAEPGKTI